MNELQSQNITDFMFWPSVHRKTVKAGINAAHKQIVADAYEKDLPEVAIAEDDILFTSPNSWKYFLEKKPKEFDLYLSMVYLGDPDKDGIVKDFTGMTCYIVSKKFYPTFLTVPDDEHIDRALSGTGVFFVCHPFIAKQYNGFSANTGKSENYDQLLTGREFL